MRLQRTKEEIGIVEWLNSPDHVRGWTYFTEFPDYRGGYAPRPVRHHALIEDFDLLYLNCERVGDDGYHGGCIDTQVVDVLTEAREIARVIDHELHYHRIGEIAYSRCKMSYLDNCDGIRMFGYAYCENHLNR